MDDDHAIKKNCADQVSRLDCIRFDDGDGDWDRISFQLFTAVFLTRQ